MRDVLLKCAIFLMLLVTNDAQKPLRGGGTPMQGLTRKPPEARSYDLQSCIPLCVRPKFFEAVFQSPAKQQVSCLAVPQVIPFCRRKLRTQKLLQSSNGAVYFVPFDKPADKYSWSQALKLCQKFGGSLPSNVIPTLTKDLSILTSTVFKGSAISASVWSSGSNMAAQSTEKFYWFEVGGGEAKVPRKVVTKVTPNKPTGVCLTITATAPAGGRGASDLVWTQVDCKSKHSVVCVVAKSCMAEECILSGNLQNAQTLKSVVLPRAAPSPTQTSSVYSYNSDMDKQSETTCAELTCRNFTLRQTLERPSFKTYQRCNKIYYFSENKMSIQDATYVCCKFDATLLSLDNQDKIDCLRNIIKDNREVDKLSVWVAGVKVALGKYAWCHSGAVIQKGIVNAVFEDELLVASTSSLLFSTSSENSNYFVCEKPSSSCMSYCESTAHCAKNAQLANVTGSVAYTHNITVATPVGSHVLAGCGSQIFFSRAMMTQQQAWKVCCTLGLRLVNIESTAKFNCIAKMYFTDIPYAETRVYHTAATYNTCTKNMWWCEPGKPVVDSSHMLSNSKIFSWNSKSIVVATLSKEEYSLSYMSLAHGVDYQAYCMCEGTRTNFVPPFTLQDKPGCKRPNCMDERCNVDDSMLDSYVSNIVVPYEFRLLKPACNREFLVGTTKENYVQAMERCCTLGFRMVAMQNKEKAACVMASMQEEGLGDVPVWTSAINWGCTSTWFWCGMNSSMAPSAVWGENEPNNFNSEEFCGVAVPSKNPNNVYELKSVRCGRSYHYMCEGNPTAVTTLVKTAPPGNCPKNSRTCTPTCTPSECPVCNNTIVKERLKATSLPVTSNVNSCNMPLVFSTDKVTFEEASAACCSRGLVLASAESIAKITCLSQLHTNVANKPATPWSYWLGATFNKCTREFWWCHSKQALIVSPDMLQPPSYSKRTASFCVTIKFSEEDFSLSYMALEPCALPQYYVCDEPASSFREVTTGDKSEKSKCACPELPAPLSLGPTEKLIGPQIKECGNLYAASTITATYAQAREVCVQNSLSLISLTNRLANKCFTKLNMDGLNMIWTSACNGGCSNRWRWRGHELPVTSEVWGQGQPDNWHQDEQCGAAKKNLSRGVFDLFDVRCERKLHFICESPEPYACSVTQCQKNRDTTKLSSEGTVAACGGEYMFSNTEVTFDTAVKRCCDLNMTLVTSITGPKLNCLSLQQKIIGHGRSNSRTYFTGAVFHPTSESFWWCNQQSPIISSSGLWVNNVQPSKDGYLIIEMQKETQSLAANGLSMVPKTDKSNRFYICESVNYGTPAPTQAPNCVTPACPDISNKRVATEALFVKESYAPSFEAYGKGCGRTYIMSSIQMSHSNATVACAKIGLQLLVLNVTQRMTCFSSLRPDLSAEYMWVSAVDLECDGAWSWCVRRVATTNVSPEMYTLNQWHADEHCLAYVGAGKLDDISCDEKLKFVCEGYSKESSPFGCPASPCVKNKTFDMDKVRDVSARGLGSIFRACDTDIFVSTKKASWEVAQKSCCDLGLKLASVESVAKRACLQAVLTTHSDVTYEVWTSAQKHSLSDKLWWCEHLRPLITDKPYYYKPSGQNKNCIFARFNEAYMDNYLYEENCAVEMFYMCERMDTKIMDTELSPEQPPPCSPTVKPSQNQFSQMKQALLDGSFKKFSSCYMKFIVSQYASTQQEAYDTCSSYGMTLNSFVAPRKIACLLDALKPSGTMGTFWTSGRMLPNDKWTWCGVHNSGLLNAPMTSDIPWDQNQPDHWRHKEFCVASNVVSDKVLMIDTHCDQKHRFVCECVPEPCGSYLCPYKTLTDTKDPQKLTDNEISVYNNSEISGFFVTRCKRTFFVSDKKLTWGEAQTACCKIGFNLFYGKIEEDFRCIKKIRTDYKVGVSKGDSRKTDNFEGEFWMGGIFNVCQEKYWWCDPQNPANNEPLNADHIASFNYAKSGGSEAKDGFSCLQLYISPSHNPGESYEPRINYCNIQSNYICEGAPQQGVE